MSEQGRRQMKKLTKEQAIEFHESGAWKNWTLDQVFWFQWPQDRLCVPMDVYHKAVEKVFGRPVFTHELGENNRENMIAELEGKPSPTLDEIIALLPADKVYLLNPDDDA